MIHKLKENERAEFKYFRFRGLVGGEEFKAIPEEVIEGGRVSPNEAVFRVVLPEHSFLTRFIYDSIEVLTQESEEYYTPINHVIISPVKGVEIVDGKLIEPDVNLPSRITGKKIVLFGVGGVGSWVAALIAVSDFEDIDLSIVDMDDVVEEHNLNRQILFIRESLGKPKAKAAEDRIKELNPSIRVRGYVEKVTLDTIRDLVAYLERKIDYSKGLEGIEGLEGLIKISESPKLVVDIANADVLLTTFDNLRARYLVSFMSKIVGVDMINAGAQEFIGNIDYLPKDGGCLVCYYGEAIKYDEVRMSCSEWGEIPVQSIVTTVSLIAALQTALLIAILANLKNIEHYYHYRGVTNSLRACPYELNKCPIHRKRPTCPKHLNSESYAYF